MNISITHPSLSTDNRIGFNCAGMMANVDWDNHVEVKRFVDMVNTIQPDMMRIFDGGGYRYVHMVKDGLAQPGLGYDLEEINRDYIAGILDDVEHSSYLGKIENAPTYSYLHKFIEVYGMFIKKPKVIYMVNILYSTPEDESATIQILLNGGVNVVGAELGNEVYNKGTFNGKFTDYLEKAAPYAEIIYDTHPMIEIGIVAAPLFEKRFEKWNLDLQAFMQSPFFRVDAIVPHIYCKVDQSIVDEYELAYGKTRPKYPIEFDYPDANLQPVFQTGLTAFTTFAEVTLRETLFEYKRLFPGQKFWVTEWGTTPPYPFGNTLLDAAYIFSAMPVWYENPEFEYLGYQTFHGPAFHASSTPEKPLDPETYTNPVFRSKFFAWYLLSYVDGYSYLETRIENGITTIVMKKDNRIALLVSNPTDYPVTLSLETNEPKIAFGFQTSTSCSFGNLYGGNGQSEIYTANEEYSKDFPVQRNVIISISEEEAVVPKYSIANAFYSIINVIEDDIPDHSGRPHIKIPKFLFGRFSKLIKRVSQA